MSELNQNRPCPDSNLVWAILCTVLCCLPLGIVSIVKAASVERLWSQGFYDEAQKASDDAMKYAKWGAIAAAIGIALYILLYVFLIGGMIAAASY